MPPIFRYGGIKIDSLVSLLCTSAKGTAGQNKIFSLKIYKHDRRGSVLNMLAGAKKLKHLHFFYRGTEFRTDYARLAELRSLLPKANMLALTATATPASRNTIAKMLCMKEYIPVIMSCDRWNIKHVCIKAPASIESSFSWLCRDLQQHKQETPKCIIYCRNIKSCGLIYQYIMGEVGVENSYIGTRSASNCLFGMFHHSTAQKNKNVIMENFCDVESKLRVVIATTAFGMGVNVPNVRVIVHWGAPHSIDGYMQQSGRAGRDGNPSWSVTYYHPSDISTIATDRHTREFCLLESCRRKYLLQHFTPEDATSTNVLSLCLCCDNCQKICKCGSCPSDISAVLDLEEEALVRVASMHDDPMIRQVQELQRKAISDKLYDLRLTLLGETCTSLLNIGLLTGLSDKVITDISANVHYIFCVEDILTQYVFDRSCAEKVLEIIENVLSN
jgi:superfamily II DNA helicase RecQ